MNYIKFIFLSLMLVFIFSSSDFAQDKNQKSSGNKTETKIDGCSDIENSCCSTTDKTVSTIKPFNEVCPVLGNKVSTKVKTVEYKGKLYGFCCAGCDDKFQKDPEKYLGNLSTDGKKYIKTKS